MTGNLVTWKPHTLMNNNTKGLVANQGPKILFERKYL